MRKSLLLLMMMTLCFTSSNANEVKTANDSLPLPADYDRFLQDVTDVSLAAQILIPNVIMKSRIEGKEVFYTLPDGETITMCIDSDSSCDKFWKRIAEENQVKDICEIPFGTSYEDAERALKAQFGDYDALVSTKERIRYEKKSYRGIKFDWIYFFFQSDGQRSYLNASAFGIDCKTKAEAVSLKKEFHELLSQRYANFIDFDNGKEYESYGALSPVPAESIFGFGIRIDIINYRESDVHIGSPYGVRIAFGPYDYIKE